MRLVYRITTQKYHNQDSSNLTSVAIVLGLKTVQVGPTSTLLRSPDSGGQKEFRALKKRCIGRRKSMSERMNGDDVTGRIGSSWIYDGAG